MDADPIKTIFGRFRDLNLLALMDDLRTRRTARGAWLTNGRLCPVAHGMAEGRLVDELHALGEVMAMGRACDYAARQLGVDVTAVRRFVEWWDSSLPRGWLLEQLEAMWAERLADADAVQEVLCSSRRPKRRPRANTV